MQRDDGTFAKIGVTTFKKLLKLGQEHARVIKEGDIFMIRGCRFEITEITEEGIKAKGIPPDPSYKVGRNDECPCGSGRKYKHCCLNS